MNMQIVGSTGTLYDTDNITVLILSEKLTNLQTIINKNIVV